MSSYKKQYALSRKDLVMDPRLFWAQIERRDYFAIKDGDLYTGPRHNRCGDGCALMGFRKFKGFYHKTATWRDALTRKD